MALPVTFERNQTAIAIMPKFNGDWWDITDTVPAGLPGELVYLITSGGASPLGLIVLQYVYFNPPTTTTAITAGTPLYFSNRQSLTVSNHVADAQTYVASTDSAIQSFAGLLLNADVAIGQYTYVLKSGYWGSIASPASVALGDRLVLSDAAATAPTDNTLVRVAAGTAPATPEALSAYVIADGAVSGGLVAGTLINTIL